ncbi:Lecithin:cholesterol acyltransferase [Ancylostoma caninum]|uniref:Lecithin:cholesterol acyltransferase n=1 Tax=Ancylostoma caninum TaxID=29170 RepID=A0A368FRA8_ANCCA|nr:Lecithin:cholesterol acyltransferase [Ancylostoma caninum]
MEANLTGKPHVVNPFCLRRTTKYFDIWLNLEELLPIAIDCFVHNMMLQTNPENGMVSNMPGVDIRISGFGTSSAVEFVDKSRVAPGMYFYLLVENLVKWGFRRDVNILGAPYDYRKAPEELGEYYLHLRKLIEKAYVDTGNKRVVMVGHSLGNIIALHLFTRIVDQTWKDKYIKAFITIGAPWAGSTKALKGFTSGHNFDAPNIFLPPMKLRPGQRTYTSLASLFPTRMAWRDDEVLATVGSTNYTLADMPAFFTRLEYEMAWKQVLRLGTLDKTLPAPGVRVYCIFGVGLPTTSRLTWTNKSFPHEQPKEIRGEGSQYAIISC